MTQAMPEDLWRDFPNAAMEFEDVNALGQA
jgi:hypothetical protein